MKSLKIYRDGRLVERVSRNDLHNTFSPKNHKPSQPKMRRPYYKNLYQEQLKTNKWLLFACGVIAILGLTYGTACHHRINNQKNEIQALQLELERSLDVVLEHIESYNQLLLEYKDCTEKLPKPKVSTGKVSYYSHDGCIGCSPNQIMANGKPFDENAMTLAHNQIPLNTRVSVTNLDNNKTVQAVVTDTGGFNRYNRVADLSKGLYEALNAKTDISIIEIAYY